MAREITEQDKARGRRLREIRKALGLSQYAIVDVLNEKALSLGLEPRYQYWTVSRAEKGSLSFEDAAVWLAIDPDKDIHGWDWFVLGIERKRVTPRFPAEAGEDLERMPPARGRRRSSGPHRKQA